MSPVPAARPDKTDCCVKPAVLLVRWPMAALTSGATVGTRRVALRATIARPPDPPPGVWPPLLQLTVIYTQPPHLRGPLAPLLCGVMETGVGPPLLAWVQRSL